MYTGRILYNHEAEIKMMALTSWRLPAKHQKQERGMRQILSHLREKPTLPTIDLRLLAPKLRQCVSPVYASLWTVLACSSPSKPGAWSSVWRAPPWSTGAKSPRPHHLLGSFHLCCTLSLVLWDDGRSWTTCPMAKPPPYHWVSFPAFTALWTLLRPLQCILLSTSLSISKYNGVPQRPGPSAHALTPHMPNTAGG